MAIKEDRLETFTARIYLGSKNRIDGKLKDIELAINMCRSFVDEFGDCVSVQHNKYIYTGGGEPGIEVVFIQYPRFPRDKQDIRGRAVSLARMLLIEMEQIRVTVIDDEYATMLTNEDLLPDIEIKK